MTYRYTEAELADIKKRQNANLENFQRNSGRGLPPETVKTMERADGVKRDGDGAPIPKKVRAKYGSEPTVVDGIRFDSKLEANYYVQLDMQRKAGDISYFLRQVPFLLPGGIIYRVDFQVFGRPLPGKFETTYAVNYYDCKGFDTKEGKLKIKQVEALYTGVKIELVRRVRKLRSL